MKPSVFENAIKKSHYTDFSKSRNTIWSWIGLLFHAKLKNLRTKVLPRVDKKLPHVHFKHQSILIPSYERLEPYELQIKEAEIKYLVTKLNGLVIKPNAIFSFWKNIGYKNKLFKTPSNFASQKIKGTTPAVSQVTNLLYWIVLHSQLEIVERYRHNYDLYPDDLRKRPFGTGATCIHNQYDLKFQNKTDSIFQIIMTYQNGVLYGELRSLTLPLLIYEVFEERHLIKKNSFNEYIRHNAVYRSIKNTKTQKTRVEYVTENHALMVYEPLEDHDVTDIKDLKAGDITL
ncbi:VanW family protein [Fusibacter ferrireducens]|uniref:VanW family protein n=1 Tax=Fusibacter ferrireducens TaxID=2785058 RepID=A0ABR9ZN55_9FIRM|nr:VanW family protein [Fusibacter ferrireducens]MBF4691871.1 VanW family protein [Fusibacter ferrireducens]